MGPYLCIKPACGSECIGCNHAISPETARRYAIAYAHLRARKPPSEVDGGGVFVGITPENVFLAGDDLDIVIADALDAMIAAAGDKP